MDAPAITFADLITYRHTIRPPPSAKGEGWGTRATLWFIYTIRASRALAMMVRWIKIIF